MVESFFTNILRTMFLMLALCQEDNLAFESSYSYYDPFYAVLWQTIIQTMLPILYRKQFVVMKNQHKVMMN